MNMLFYLWLLLFTLWIILELFSPGLFFFLSLAVGSATAAIAAFAHVEFYFQCYLFVITTLIAFFLLKIWVKRTERGTPYKTNVHALIGQHVKVVEPVTQKTKGWVAIKGQLWAAYASDATVLEPGDYGKVIQVSGSHVIIQKK